MSIFAVRLLAVGALTIAAVVIPARAQSNVHLTPQAAVIDYCAAWNTTDRAARDLLLARVWAADGVWAGGTVYGPFVLPGGGMSLSPGVGLRDRLCAGAALFRLAIVKWLIAKSRGLAGSTVFSPITFSVIDASPGF